MPFQARPCQQIEVWWETLSSLSHSSEAEARRSGLAAADLAAVQAAAVETAADLSEYIAAVGTVEAGAAVSRQGGHSTDFDAQRIEKGD